jgi:predicted transcriptional regulator of viral defense system
MAPKNYVQASAILPETKIYEFLELADGFALAGTVKIVPVRHGGEKESGERIDTKEVMAPAEKVGITRNSVYAQIKRMTDRKQIKRVDVGAYLPVLRKGRAAAEAATPAKAKVKRKVAAHGEETAADRIVREVAAKQQNGSGEGVSLADLKKAMTKEGYVPTGVGPALSLLVRKNKLVRVGTGMYRTPPDPAASHEPTSEAVVEG